MADFPKEILDFLPPLARTKALDLIERQAAAHAALNDLDNKVWEARDRASQARSDLDRRLMFARHTGDVAKIKEDEQPKLDAVDEGASRLAEAYGRALARFEAWAFVDEVRAWVGEYRLTGGRLRYVPPAVSKVKSGSYADAVAAVRVELEEINAEIARLDHAPMPLDDLREAIVAEVDAVAAKGALVVNPSRRGGNPANLADRLKLHIHNTLSQIGDGGTAFFVWMMRDEIVRRLTDLAGQAEFEGAISDGDREAAYADLAIHKLDAERREEALIEAAALIGQTIDRRRDADPRAILNVIDEA